MYDKNKKEDKDLLLEELKLCIQNWHFNDGSFWNIMNTYLILAGLGIAFLTGSFLFWVENKDPNFRNLIIIIAILMLLVNFLWHVLLNRTQNYLMLIWTE